MLDFILHDRLASDTFFIADLPLSQLRLINHADVVWVILVPRISNISECFELPTAQQVQLTQETNAIAQLLKQHFPCDKINLGMIGNIVPQLHVHVVVRRRDDACWPNPVWGQKMVGYAEEARSVVMEKIRQLVSAQERAGLV